MDYVHSLLIIEDDLDDDGSVKDLEMGAFGELDDNVTPVEGGQAPEPDGTIEGPVPDWCVCGCCRPMSQEKQMLSTKEMYNKFFKVC